MGFGHEHSSLPNGPILHSSLFLALPNEVGLTMRLETSLLLKKSSKIWTTEYRTLAAESNHMINWTTAATHKSNYSPNNIFDAIHCEFHKKWILHWWKHFYLCYGNPVTHCVVLCATEYASVNVPRKLLLPKVS